MHNSTQRILISKKYGFMNSKLQNIITESLVKNINININDKHMELSQLHIP